MDYTKQCAHFQHILPATKRRTDKQDTKHDMWSTLISMSLVKIVGQTLPPSQRSSVENLLVLVIALDWSIYVTDKFCLFFPETVPDRRGDEKGV